MKKQKQKKQVGDILGISNATGEIPHANIRKGGHPRGIELESPSQSSALQQHAGATSIDMGGAGEGNAIKRRSRG